MDMGDNLDFHALQRRVAHRFEQRVHPQLPDVAPYHLRHLHRFYGLVLRVQGVRCGAD